MSTEKQSFPNNWKGKLDRKSIHGSSAKQDSDSQVSHDSTDHINVDHNESKKENIIDTFLAHEQSMAIYREKLSAIKKFVQAMNEISPIIDLVSLDVGDGSDFKVKISSLLNLQVSFVNLIKSQWGLNDDDANDKYVISIIAKHVSDLIGSGFLTTNKDYGRVEGLLELLDDFVSDRPYIGQIIDDNLLSSDVLVNVKLGLFPSSLRFQRKISSLSENEMLINYWLRWHHNITVSLSKDLAFNWDTTSSFKDRERLFESSLSHCAVIAEDIWINNFLGSLNSRLTNFSRPSIILLLDDFEKAVIECDMGYLSHDLINIEWLKNSFIDYVVRLSERFSIFNSNSMDVQLFFIDKACSFASLAWREASTKYLNQINSMTEIEMDAWSKGEGLKPMDFSLLAKSLTESLLEVFANKFAMNEEILMHNAKSKLAMLWGLSDAVCKIKKREE
jgi:hypothetical protein